MLYNTHDVICNSIVCLCYVYNDDTTNITTTTTTTTNNNNDNNIMNNINDNPGGPGCHAGRGAERRGGHSLI